MYAKKGDSIRVGRSLDALPYLPRSVTDIDLYFSGPYRCFHDRPDTVQMQAAVANISKTIAREGPFDGIIGFSQGAALAASLIIAAAKNNMYDNLFELAVFIGSPLPYELVECESGDGWTAKICSKRTTSINIPSIHVMGEQDDFFSDGQQLVEICTAQTRVIVHGEGHVIPRTPAFTAKLVGAVAALVEDIENMA